MAVESTDFELSTISSLSADDLLVLAAGGVSSAIGNATLGALRAFVIASLVFSDLPGVAAAAHEHEIADVTGLPAALDEKLDAATGTIGMSQVTGLSAALALKMDADWVPAYGDLTGLSTDIMEALGAADYAALRGYLSLGDLALIDWGATMASDAQTTDYFVAARSGSASTPVTVTGAQLAAMVLAEATIGSIDGLTAALAAKMADDAEIPQSQITGLVADLAAKLDSSSEIAQSQITGLVADLAAKLGASDPIPQSQITDLAATLAALTIPLAQLSDAGATGLDLGAAASPAAARSVLELGTAATMDADAFLPADGGVAIADITGLADALDAKVNIAAPIFSAPIPAVQGSISAPGYTFENYTELGFYAAGPDTIGIVHQGFEAHRIGHDFISANSAERITFAAGRPANLQARAGGDDHAVIGVAQIGGVAGAWPHIVTAKATGSAYGVPGLSATIGGLYFAAGDGGKFIDGAAIVAVTPAAGAWATDVAYSGLSFRVANGGAVAEAVHIAADKTFTATGSIVAPRFYTRSILIADDAAASVTVGTSWGGLILIGGTGSNLSGLVGGKTSGSAECYVLAQPSTLIAATTGVLTGTTGTDGKLTVSTHTDGKIYLENRRGGPGTVTVTIVG